MNYFRLDSSMADSWWSVAVIAVIVTIVTSESNPKYGTIPTLPGKSCRDIYQVNPFTRSKSDYYVVKVDARPVIVYCDMELEGGGEKGWMKVTSVDVAKDSCPHGWKKITSPIAACRAPTDNAGCYSAQFSTHEIPYSRVCGMVIGYQKGTTDGFNAFASPSKAIDSIYVDGVSITYGTPRKHIWTYGMGYNEKGGGASCPCSKNGGTLPPSFVHENYYCESASYDNPSTATYFTSNPVWDGKGCPSLNSCCSEPNLPWFYRQIPLTSDKNIEARICHDQVFKDEGVLVKEIKLYIQ